MPQDGLIPTGALKVVRASSESRSNGKLAAHAIDGDAATLWHSQWSDDLQRHPHELIIDLGGERTVRGFRYLCRQDQGWNGALKDCEFYVGDAPDRCDRLATKARFAKVKTAQQVRCDPVRGRYLRLRSISEVNDGPWASVAELGIIGE